MRVRVVSRIFHPEPSAATQRLLTLVHALKRDGADVSVLTARPPRNVLVTPLDVSVQRVPVLRDSSGYVRGYLPYLSFDLQAMFRVLFSRRTDAIVIEPPPTTGLLVGLAARIRRIRYIYYAADIWSDASAQTGAHPLVVRVVRWMESHALKHASGVLAVTDAVAARVRDLAPSSDVSVVGHGVDLDLYRARIDGTADIDLVYVGTMSEWHGAEVLIAALARLERGSVRAAIIGQGSQWERVKEAVERESLHNDVKVLRTVPSDQAAEWLRSARVSVATLRPGAGYDFAVPTKLYSSVAAGTPVIYAGPDPVHALVRDEGLGWAVAHDAESLADAIVEALRTDEDLRLRSHVVAWAQANVSAESVGDRTRIAIRRAIDDR